MNEQEYIFSLQI